MTIIQSTVSKSCNDLQSFQIKGKGIPGVNKALSKDTLEIDDKIIDFAKRCTMKKIVSCDLYYAAGSADIS